MARYACLLLSKSNLSVITRALISLYTVKKVSDFPVPSLPSRFIYSRPGRVWSVTSRLENFFVTLFLQCSVIFRPNLRWKGGRMTRIESYTGAGIYKP